jgi:hypothetical protein
MHEKNIHTMVYSEELECLITGGEDCMIQLYYLNQVRVHMRCCVLAGRGFDTRV